MATQNLVDHSGNTSDINEPRMKNIGMCQIAQMTPSTRLEASALHLLCSRSRAYPRHPISSGSGP